jgi:hypothetical protein
MRYALSAPNFGDYADPAVAIGLGRDVEAAGWDATGRSIASSRASLSISSVTGSVSGRHRRDRGRYQSVVTG